MFWYKECPRCGTMIEMTSEYTRELDEVECPECKTVVIIMDDDNE